MYTLVYALIWKMLSRNYSVLQFYYFFDFIELVCNACADYVRLGFGIIFILFFWSGLYRWMTRWLNSAVIITLVVWFICSWLDEKCVALAGLRRCWWSQRDQYICGTRIIILLFLGKNYKLDQCCNSGKRWLSRIWIMLAQLTMVQWRVYIAYICVYIAFYYRYNTINIIYLLTFGNYKKLN